jgi:3-deoxy-D-manno-octulosonate 8-phosphate phosphatase (KDO 8-P phosphatase)
MIDTHTRFKMFKLLILDIDGVMTDGTKYYNLNNEVICKQYNDKDFTAIKRLKADGIAVCFLSGDVRVNEAMAEGRKIDFYSARDSNGKIDKIKFIKEFTRIYGATADEMAYVGDDIYDVEIMKKVGYSYCPFDAPNYVKTNSKCVLSRTGGTGVVAELYDLLVKQNKIEEFIDEL